MEDSLARGICHGRQRDQIGSGRRKSKRRSSTPTGMQLTGPKTEDERSKSQIFFLNTFYKDIYYYLETNKSQSVAPLVRFHSNTNFPQDLDRCEYDDNYDDSSCILARNKSESRTQADHSLIQSTATWISGYDFARPRMSLNLTDSLDGHILQYHDLVICSLTTLLDNENQNPNRFAIMPLISSSENVLAAVLAIGATKLAFMYNDEALYQRRAFFHQQRATSKLSRLLWNVNGDLNKWLEALATTLVFCWCDVSFLVSTSSF